jgi:hypothetical protein
VDTGFRKRSCSTNKLERDDDSKKSHRALAASFPSRRDREQQENSAADAIHGNSGAETCAFNISDMFAKHA